MTCNRTLEWIIDDLVVGLSPDDRIALDDHLASCESCAALARQYRQMWSDLPAAAVLRAPTHGWSTLEAKIAGEIARGETGRRALSRAVNWMTLLRRAAVAAVLLGIGVVVGLRVGEEEGPAGASDSIEVVGDTAMPQFVLLFYEIPGNAELRARVSNDLETWARAQFRSGVVVNGAELADGAAWAGSAPGDIAGVPRLTHYIRIRATDLEHARRIAASAPVAAYGGVIEVRALDP